MNAEYTEEAAIHRIPEVSHYLEALSAGLVFFVTALVVSLGMSVFFYLGSGPDPLPVIRAIWVPSGLDPLFARSEMSELLSDVWPSASLGFDKTPVHQTRHQFVHDSPARITATVERLLRGKVTPVQITALELVLAQNEVLHSAVSLPGLRQAVQFLDVAAPQSPWLQEGRPRRTLVALNRAEHADPAQVYAFLAKVQARKQALSQGAGMWLRISAFSGVLLVLCVFSRIRLSRRESRIARLLAALNSGRLAAATSHHFLSKTEGAA